MKYISIIALVAVTCVPTMSPAQSDTDDGDGEKLRVTLTPTPDKENESNRIIIQSRSDQVVVKKIRVNRGNCPIVQEVIPIFTEMYRKSFPRTLRFGSETAIDVYCDPVEIEVTTEKNTYVLTEENKK